MPSLAADDEVLLKIDSASICGTDLHSADCSLRICCFLARREQI